MNELFVSAFVTLFVVIDPPGCAPIYAGLTRGASRAQATVMALRASLIALDMVFEKRTERREKRAEDVRAQSGSGPEVEDISVFPMAMPMIAGPGSIATVMLLMARAEGTEATLTILAALAAVLLMTFAALAAAGPIMKVLGTRVEAVITRLLGVLLAALAAQYVADGIKQVLA